MNTNQVAERLGVSPRQLRQFLRSPQSTYQAVGSGARYSFQERDVPELKRRYERWLNKGRSSSVCDKPRTPRVRTMTPQLTQSDKDALVWAEEAAERAAAGLGPVEVPDIRDPQVRRRVLADAKEREERLMMLLMSKGLHITQMGDRR